MIRQLLIESAAERERDEMARLVDDPEERVRLERIFRVERAFARAKLLRGSKVGRSKS